MRAYAPPARVQVEVDGLVASVREDAIEREDVQVHEAAEPRVEALHEGDAPGVASFGAARRLPPARDSLVKMRFIAVEPEP